MLYSSTIIPYFCVIFSDSSAFSGTKTLVKIALTKLQYVPGRSIELNLIALGSYNVLLEEMKIKLYHLFCSYFDLSVLNYRMYTILCIMSQVKPKYRRSASRTVSRPDTIEGVDEVYQFYFISNETKN